MDIATILGILTGVGLIVYAIFMGGSLTLFVNIPSLMIVGGGTIAAVLIAYPLNEVLKVFSTIKRVFLFKNENPTKLISELTQLAQVAKKDGVLALEKHSKSASNKHLRQGLQMIADGISRNDINQIISNDIANIQKQHETGRQMFSEMGKYAPAFGMVGTLIGLVQMLANLEDTATIGPKMAVALLTTFYGAFVANVFFIPMAVKLKRRSEIETRNMKMILEGILSIQSGENPNFLQDRLMVYLEGAGSKGEKSKK